MKKSISFTFAIVILILGTLGITYSVKAYPKMFETRARISAEEGKISLDQNISIIFSETMVPESVERNISIEPAAKFLTHWEDNNKKFVISPETVWRADQKYVISINGSRNMMFVENDFQFSFQTVSFPKIIEFFPEKGSEDVIIDIEDPITMVFDQSVGDYRLKIDINPYEKITYNLENSNQRIELMPEKELKKGQAYEVEVSIRHKIDENGQFTSIYKSNFKTKPLPPQEWAKDLSLRIEQAKKFTEAKIKTGKYLDVNLKSQVMSLFEEGKLVDAFLVSSGKGGMETPLGEHKIYNKHPKAWSSRYGLYMPFWNAILADGKVGIHELPEWPNGYKEGQNHLGIPVSHGCIRLGVGPAETVYNWAPIGTPVVIHN